MGLIVKRGNPSASPRSSICSKPAVRFVNRDPTPARAGCSISCSPARVDGSQIGGYERIEFTHAAVAAYVASEWSSRFGVEAAARQFELDFVRLVTEDYFSSVASNPRKRSVKRLLAIMRSEEFQAEVSRLPGYRLNEPGSIKTVKEVFTRGS